MGVALMHSNSSPTHYHHVTCQSRSNQILYYCAPKSWP